MSFVVPDTIPEDWSVTRLGTVLQERNQTVSDRDFRPLSVTMDGVVPQLDQVAKTSHSDNRKLVRSGDLVVNSRSDRKGAAGLAMVDGSVSPISIVMMPRRGHRRYLHHLLRSVPFQEEFYRRGKGIHSDLWSTRYDALKRIHVPFPPLSIQKAIANFLDRQTSRIDTLIDKKKRLLELLEEKRTALITRAVTKGLDPDVPMKDSGVEWLGKIPEHWEVRQLKHVASLQSGSSITSTELTEDGEFPVYGGNGIRGYCNSFTHEGLYPIVGRQGALAGNVNYAKGRFWASEHAVVITPRQQVEVRWLGETLRAMDLNQYAQAAAQPGLAVAEIASLKLPVPPTSEQEGIARFLKGEKQSLRELKEKITSAISLLQEYRTALISAAVTGKIDVRDHPDAAA